MAGAISSLTIEGANTLPRSDYEVGSWTKWRALWKGFFFFSENRNTRTHSPLLILFAVHHLATMTGEYLRLRLTLNGRTQTLRSLGSLTHGDRTMFGIHTGLPLNFPFCSIKFAFFFLTCSQKHPNGQSFNHQLKGCSHLVVESFIPTKPKVKALYSYNNQTKSSEDTEADSQEADPNFLEPCIYDPHLLLLAGFSNT